MPASVSGSGSFCLQLSAHAACGNAACGKAACDTDQAGGQARSGINLFWAARVWRGCHHKGDLTTREVLRHRLPCRANRWAWLSDSDVAFWAGAQTWGRGEGGGREDCAEQAGKGRCCHGGPGGRGSGQRQAQGRHQQARAHGCAPHLGCSVGPCKDAHGASGVKHS